MPDLDPRRQLAITEAETWLGTRFEHGTMIKGRGVDCIMLLVACFRAAGVLPPDFDPRPYPRAWFIHRDDERYLDGMNIWGREVLHPEPGDVGLWKFGRSHSHGGLLVTPFVDDPNPHRRKGDVIHAFEPYGQVALCELINGALLRRPVKWFCPYS